MAKFSTSNGLAGTPQAMTTSNKSIVSVLGAASAPRRGKIYDLMFGTIGTPADTAFIYNILTMTADDGTKTNVTPNPLDPADAAATTLSRANFTAEGTVGAATTSRFYVGVNQRASYRWVAAPGSEIVWAATANTGYVVVGQGPSGGGSGTAATGVTLLFEEQ